MCECTDLLQQKMENSNHGSLHSEKLKLILTNYYLENLVIEEASLGNDSGILGAAALCF